MRRRLPPRRSSASGAPIVWQVDLASVNIELGDDPAARPALALVMGDGQIIVGDLVANPASSAEGVAVELAKHIRTAMARAGRPPDFIDVLDSAVAVALAMELNGEAIVVRAVRDLADINDAIHHFDQHVIGKPPASGSRPRIASPKTWAGWKLEGAQIARLFAAAAEYYRTAPWVNIVNDDILQCAVANSGTWFASVMGNAQELYGIALYADEDDLFRTLDADPLNPGDAMQDIAGPILSLSFDPRSALSGAMRREVRDAKWEVAGQAAYPVMVAINTIGGGIAARDMDDVIAILGAISRFAKAKEKQLSGAVAVRLPIRWRDKTCGVSITFDAEVMGM